MKDYNQMAQAVFRRRDEYLAARKKKNAMLLKAGIPLCSIVLVALLGFTLWMNKLPEIPTLPSEPASSTETTAEDMTEEITEAQVTPTKPTQSMQVQDATEPYVKETVPFLPTDPVEKPGDVPATSTKPDHVADSTSATVEDEEDAVPPALPNDPGAPPTSEDHPIARPDSPTVDATSALEPDWGDLDGPSTEAPGDSVDTEPTATDATEPVTGPLEITVGGKKYTAQMGDMVSYTAELYVEGLFETFAAGVAHGSQLQVVEVVDPSEEDPSLVHFPNLKGGGEMLNYHRDRSKKGEKEIFVSGIKLSGYNFKEQKVLFTFDFLVQKPGFTQIVLDINELIGKGGAPEYFVGGNQLNFDDIKIEEYITVTPAQEVEIPTAPKEEEETVPSFTYPEESYEGDLTVNCDGRTYAAEVGQRITYVVELEAQEKFEDIQFKVKYTDDGVDLLVPEETEDKTKAEISMPYLGEGGFVSYFGQYIENGQTKPEVIAGASRIRKYDFRQRKVMIELDFIVTRPGEVTFDLVMEDITIDGGEIDWMDPHRFNGTAYFYKGEQLIFEGIEIYEYVIVH